MSWLPKLRKEFRITGDPDDMSHDLVSELPRRGLSIQSHHPGSRICASILRPMSLSGGQVVRIDLHPVDGGEVEAMVESKFKFPGVDFTHENEKNVSLVEELLRKAVPA